MAFTKGGCLFKQTKTTNAKGRDRDACFFVREAEMHDDGVIDGSETLWFGVMQRCMRLMKPGYIQPIQGACPPDTYIIAVEAQWYPAWTPDIGLDPHIGVPKLAANYAAPIDLDSVFVDADTIVPIPIAILPSPYERAANLVLHRDNNFWKNAY